MLAVVSSQVQKDAQTVSFLAQETAEVRVRVYQRHKIIPSVSRVVDVVGAKEC